MERRELERQIVEKEWLMFQQVQGVNGRAAVRMTGQPSYYASQSV